MEYRQYGRTGKKVSVVGFGAMRFENPDDMDSMAEAVYLAYKLGINYFDTAPAYCKDKSEDIVGMAVRKMTPGTFYVSTKCGDSDGGRLRASLERSLKRLNVPRIHFFHIWCVLTMDDWRNRKSGGAVAAALKARDEGLIEHLAVSSHLPGDKLKEVLAEGVFEGVTLGYCAINFPYRLSAVEEAGKLGLGLVTMNPLGGGIIPANAERFGYIKGPGDRSVVEAAIRFNISHPAVTCALVGCSNARHVRQAAAAAEGFRPYPPEHVEAVRSRVMEQFNGLCTGCGYCLPCPSDVDIPKLMDAYNMSILESKPTSISDRLNWHWGMKPEAARLCSLCGACEERCTQHLPIMERLKEIASLADEKK